MRDLKAAAADLLCDLIGASLGLAIIVLWTTVSAHARSPLLNESGGNSFLNAPFMLGLEFTVGPDDIQVTSLGYQDRTGGDGLTSAHGVGLWTLDQVQLASVTVQTGTDSSLYIGYRYEDLDAPVILDANTSYILVGAATPGDPGYTFGVRPADQDLLAQGLIVVQARWTSGNSLSAFPSETTENPTGAFWTSANLLFDVPDADTDGDGVLDVADNCTLAANGN